NSALDRVDVENNLRPQYSEYVNLQALGIDGPSMSVDGSSQNPSNMHTKQVGADVKMRNYVSSNSNPNGAPSFGNQFKEARPRCANYPMEGAMSKKSQADRGNQSATNKQASEMYRQMSGF
ncbi:MAG: hypothetical protein ACW98X_26475, partial [Promethearchaeota archaeon]